MSCFYLALEYQEDNTMRHFNRISLALLLVVAGLTFIISGCSDQANPVSAGDEDPVAVQSPGAMEKFATPKLGDAPMQMLFETASVRGDIELCGDGIDNDGDGSTDEQQCQLSPTSAPTSDQGIIPELWDDNPNCAAMGFGFGFKVNLAPDGTYPFVTANGNELTGGALPDPSNSVTISNSDGTTFDWSSTLGIDAVFVKGGNIGGNLYVYSPEDTGDGGLSTPAAGPEVSHIEFCYDYEVDVTKTAETSLTRTYDWDITKEVNEDYMGFPGDDFPHEYEITVNRTGSTDSDWAVGGTITIENNTPFSATVTNVTDVISGDIDATVTCAEGFPYPVPPGGSLACTYEAALPDGNSRTNTATVETSGPVAGGAATIPFDFSDPDVTEANPTVDVTDDFGTPGDDSDDLNFGPLGDGGTANYDRDFECPADESLYEDGVYTEETVNTASIDDTDKSDDATVTVTCYIPAKAKVNKTTTEGDEDIGQFPFKFELRNPGGDLVETVALNAAGEINFTADIEDEGTWTVKEVLPAGWISITSLECTFTVAFPDNAGETFTCDFDNTEKSRLDLVKLTNGQPTTNQTWTFEIYEGPDGFDGTTVASDNTPPALLDFGLTDLDPTATYTLCELEVPAGYSTFWQIDTNGDGNGDVTVVPYNPNADDDPSEDLGNRCVDVGANTNIDLAPGTTLHFVVDNQAPGGAPRTPGYWKNWNECSGGGQAANAARNGGHEEGFWLLEDVLDPHIGGGITWDDIQSDDFTYVIDDCDQAVSILDQRDGKTGRKRANDAAYTLAMHLLAAQLNFGAGACTTQDVLDAALEAENLLDGLDFNGEGSYLRPRDAEYATALELANLLDQYNNGAFCGN